MGEIEPTREWDALVAQVMGMVRLSTSRVDCWWWGDPSTIGNVEHYGTIRAYEEYLDSEKAEDATDEPPARYTTDPAQVVPMMERLWALAGRWMVRLDYGIAWRLDGPDGLSSQSLPIWTCVMWPVGHGPDDAIVMRGATANLALGAALLAVWERRKDADGG